MGEVLEIHNSVFKTQQRLYYYQEILRNPENPFWIAEDTDDSEILGYIACKVQYDKGMVYIASLAEQKDVVGTLPPLIEKAVKQAKKLKAKAIYTHSRKSSTKTREALAYLGFEESVDGKFRDGETKYKYELTFRAGKDKIVKNTKAKRKTRCLQNQIRLERRAMFHHQSRAESNRYPRSCRSESCIGRSWRQVRRK